MGGGTRVASGGGNQNTTVTQQAVIPEELKPLYSQTAKNITDVQNQASLTGNTSYSKQMLNPAYTQWYNQYGQPNSAGVVPAQPGGNYSMLWANAFSNPTYENYPQNIPAAPPMYIPDPSSAVQTGTNFINPQVQQVAPLSDLERQAMALSPDLAKTPLNELTAMRYADQIPGLAAKTVSNADYYRPGAFENSDYYKTALNAFKTGAAPTIENQMALAGLGRSSSMARALGDSWAGVVPSVLSQYSTQYVEPEMARQESDINRQINSLASLVPILFSAGTQDTARMNQAIASLLQTGNMERSIEQAKNDAEYSDMLRRQALAEEALYTPMGMLLPSSIGQSAKTVGGSTTTQSSLGGTGGLFK